MKFNTPLAQTLESRILENGSSITFLLVVSTYFSSSLAINLSGVLGLFWFLSAQFMALPGILNRNPVAAWSLFLFLWFIVGSSYTSAMTGDAFSMIMKYRELIFIPVLISFLTTKRYRDRLWTGFIIASALILLISYLMHIGILGLNKQGDPSFKSRITHSILISFFAFFCAHKAYAGERYAKLYLVLLLLSVYNLFFIVEGRTRQLTATLLALLFALQRFTKKALLLTLLVMAILLAFYLAFSDKATRINEGVVNIQSDLKPDAREIPSSMGQRYMYWRYSLQLIVTILFNSPFFDNAERHWFASMIALCFASLQVNTKAEINHA